MLSLEETFLRISRSQMQISLYGDKFIYDQPIIPFFTNNFQAEVCIFIFYCLRGNNQKILILKINKFPHEALM